MGDESDFAAYLDRTWEWYVNRERELKSMADKAAPDKRESLYKELRDKDRLDDNRLLLALHWPDGVPDSYKDRNPDDYSRNIPFARYGNLKDDGTSDLLGFCANDQNDPKDLITLDQLNKLGYEFVPKWKVPNSNREVWRVIKKKEVENQPVTSNSTLKQGIDDYNKHIDQNGRAVVEGKSGGVYRYPDKRNGFR